MGMQGIEKNLDNEIMEEVGIKVKNSKLIGNNVRMSFSGKTNRVRLLYHCERESGTAQALDDTNDVQRVPMEALETFTPMNDLLQNDIQTLLHTLS